MPPRPLLPRWSLFDHLVGAEKERGWNTDLQRLGGLLIDNELERVGCWTGISPGLAPRKILSTKVAACCTICTRSGPYDSSSPEANVSRDQPQVGMRWASAVFARSLLP